MTFRILLCFVLAGIVTSILGQNTIDMTFSAVNNASHVQLDSIKVMNRTQGGDTVLYWPDTVLSFNYVGMSEIFDKKTTFTVLQNYPNPVTKQTTVSLYVPEKDQVRIIVTDLLGRVLVSEKMVLGSGEHDFRFIPGNGNWFVFTAIWRGYLSSVKILHINAMSDNSYSLDYIGYTGSSQQKMAIKGIQGFQFNPGDELLSIGYYDMLQSGRLDKPQANGDYFFQFATNIPCPGTPTLIYEGQTYTTIQIFSQCWMQQNLNVGMMIQGIAEMTDNGMIEKYCNNNDTNKCNLYGGLYQWREMMQYSTQQGVRGICPYGWHIPTDEEWKVLEGAVDSQYGIGDSIWDTTGHRGSDGATNLKTMEGWVANGNGTDLFGFSAWPGGGRMDSGNFYIPGAIGYWWTSTEVSSDYAMYRALNQPKVLRFHYRKGYGMSVRCILDN